ncbi:hypothetical protein [Oceaniglobus roseus]|uniref:hypothetical protein n=1 Tax=Oceaniglobus roseus TaxID=1737570 RepID=UPI000C7EA238|nr:hypothetical protein [Kandeliimicrobium roseum]
MTLSLNLNMLIDPATALARGEALFLGELPEQVKQLAELQADSATSATAVSAFDGDAFREAQDAANSELADVVGLALALEELTFEHPGLNTFGDASRPLYAVLRTLVDSAKRAEQLQDAVWEAAVKRVT